MIYLKAKIKNRGLSMPRTKTNDEPRKESSLNNKEKQKDKITRHGIFSCFSDMSKLEFILFSIILVAGCLFRVLFLDKFPAGLNQDEAFGGYEAISLMRTGADSYGFHLPVYLTTWGSGMSVLPSYMMIPWIAIFGNNIWCIRMPQAILGSIAIAACFFLVKRITSSNRAALISMFVLAINPWHFMMSRWGMDCNMAPHFMLFALLFFCIGIEKPKFLILSAINYGLCLYCYALFWPFAAATLLLQIIYLFVMKKFKFNRYYLISGILLFVMALPLLLFLLVNNGTIEQVSTPFFTVPKLIGYRGSQFSFEGMSKKLMNIINIITSQNDGLIWNATPKYGVFYKFGLPFVVLGIAYLIKEFIKKCRIKEFSYEIFILIQIAVSILIASMTDTNINRANYFFIPLTICMGFGIYFISTMLKKEVVNNVLIIGLGIMLCYFCAFADYYFTDYEKDIGYYFSYGVDGAIKFADKLDKEVYVTNSITYSKVMYLTAIDPKLYRDTVQYKNYPNMYLDIYGFGKYHFVDHGYEINPDCVYVVNNGEAYQFEGYGFTTKEFGNYAVCYMQ